MDMFLNGQRIKVVNGPDTGKTGTVKTIESQSGYACVQLDEQPAQMEYPNSFHSHDVQLAPGDCEPIPSAQ